MMPAPAADVHYVDPVSRYRVRSLRPTIDRGCGRTEVLDPAGNVLWSVWMHTGHRHLDLSPDGQFLVLSDCQIMGRSTSRTRATRCSRRCIATAS
jgi:hypothetical protein